MVKPHKKEPSIDSQDSMKRTKKRKENSYGNKTMKNMNIKDTSIIKGNSKVMAS